MSQSDKMTKCKCGVTFVKTTDTRCYHCIKLAKKNKAEKRALND